MFARLDPGSLDRRRGGAAIGVDVGGTKTALGLVDAASLTLLARRVIPTGAQRGGEAVLAGVREHAAELAALASRGGHRIVGLGLAVPENVDLTGRITSSAVIPRWNELPVAAEFNAIAPVAIEADVRAAAFAEACLGAGREHEYHLFLTVGTGISYCAVVAGRPFAGAHGGAMHVGTTVLPGEGKGEGPERCLEEISSGAALVRRYRSKGGTASRAEDVLAAARNGDRVAGDVLAAGARALGAGIALLLNMLDPQAVIIGGGLGSADTEYGARAIGWARRYAHAHAAGAVLARGRLGPDAGVIGAGLVGLAAASHPNHQSEGSVTRSGS